jgi:hypothetical protein
MILAAILSFIACEQDEEVTYSQFNGQDDSIGISVGAAELLPSATIDLKSTTGLIVVGSASVDYSGGPVNTTHTFTINVLNAYEDQVSRVSIEADAGDRGQEEYDMVADSADEGLFQLQLVSVGTEDEQREDLFTIRLWEEGEGSSIQEPESEPETEEPEESNDTGESGR